MAYDDEDSGTVRYATLGQLARYVGVSVRTIQRLRKNGTLPAALFVRFSKRLVRVKRAT